jgi:hypothetical protein
MPKTEADEQFEAYLVEHGYDPGEHEPDLTEIGVDSTPDYLPTNATGERVVCEVKGFGVNELTRRLGRQRMVTAGPREQYGPIRNQVRAAARILRPLAASGLPLVVVLTRSDPGVMVDLSIENVVAALYGDRHIAFTIDPRSGAATDEGRQMLGRDGALTNDRQYVSAVAVLSGEAHASVERRAVFAEVRAATPGFSELPLAEQANRYDAALEGRAFSPGYRHWLDVIEALSPTATRLPDHWFSGRRDSRWRWIELEDGGMRLDRAWGPDVAGFGEPDSDAERDARNRT